MKWYHWFGIAALMAAVVYGPAAIGWVWQNGVIPLARTIAGADDVPITIVVGVAEPVADTAPEADEAAVAPAPTTEAPAAVCNGHGQMAGSAPNNGVEGAPLGGAYEACAIVAQVWGSDGLGYVVALAPRQWIRLQAQGLAAWLIDPDKVEEAVADSVASIEARGETTPTVVRFDQGASASAMPGIVAGPYLGPLAP